jgi:hypothetical protein
MPPVTRPQLAAILTRHATGTLIPFYESAASSHLPSRPTTRNAPGDGGEREFVTAPPVEREQLLWIAPSRAASRPAFESPVEKTGNLPTMAIGARGRETHGNCKGAAPE